MVQHAKTPYEEYWDAGALTKSVLQVEKLIAT
jgi:hypothetical protein